MDHIYIVVLAIIAFLSYTSITSSFIDMIFYIVFFLLGVSIGQDIPQIPNLRSIISKNQKLYERK